MVDRDDVEDVRRRLRLMGMPERLRIVQASFIVDRWFEGSNVVEQVRSIYHILSNDVCHNFDDRWYSPFSITYFRINYYLS